MGGTIGNAVAAAYRATIPRGWRDRVWQARHAGLEITLRRIWRACRIAAEHPLAEVRLPFGWVAVDLRDAGVGQVIHDLRDYEPKETAALRRLLRPGQVFVDIGANVGYFSALAGMLVGPGGKVVSFEPEEHNHRLLMRTLELNGLAQATAVRSALGDRQGEATLRKSDCNFGDHRVGAAAEADGRATQTVPLATLDSALAALGVAEVDFLKMDVQGYETFVLRGMRGTLAGTRPMTVLCEYWPHGMAAAGGDPAEFLRIFAEHGFSAALLGPGGVEIPIDIVALPSKLPPFDPAEPEGCFVNVLFRRDAAATGAA